MTEKGELPSFRDFLGEAYIVDLLLQGLFLVGVMTISEVDLVF